MRTRENDTAHIVAALDQIEQESDAEMMRLARILSAAAYIPEPSWYRRLLAWLRGGRAG